MTIADIIIDEVLEVMVKLCGTIIELKERIEHLEHLLDIDGRYVDNNEDLSEK